MDYNNFDNNTDDEKINPFIGIKKKSYKKSIIFASSLILIGFILVMTLAFKFVGEDGYIREDAPGEWVFIALIPVILGSMFLLITLFKMKKNAESYTNSSNFSEMSPEQSNKSLGKYLKTLNKAQYILIVLSVIFLGVLIILAILGKISWAELIDALF